MSADEWITDDGIHYYHRPEVYFETTYSFDEEGMNMYAEGVEDPIGSITWGELETTGGDTYVPSNMRLEVNPEKEIILGFKGSTGKNAVRLSMASGFPQVFAEDVEGYVDTISAKSIDFLDETGQKTGARIVSNEYGELVAMYRHENGRIVNANLGAALTDWAGG